MLVNMGRILKRGDNPSYFLAKACKKAWQDAEIRGWDENSDK